ncbi:hypothetical protein T492DRAFT_480345 [Pavlovales sp. CCMP2436]|nr:hypothetical protein T492DRAFT_480345 [Pavlovales sp. CCMP2436]
MPGHGRTGRWRWVRPTGALKSAMSKNDGSGKEWNGGDLGEALVPSMELTVAAVCELVRTLCAGHRVLLVGYSLGGRVALAAARALLEQEKSASIKMESSTASDVGISNGNDSGSSNNNDSGSSSGSDCRSVAGASLAGVLLLSTDPGIEQDADRSTRTATDRALSQRVEMVGEPAGWGGVLGEWYAAPLWGPGLRAKVAAMADADSGAGTSTAATTAAAAASVPAAAVAAAAAAAAASSTRGVASAAAAAAAAAATTTVSAAVATAAAAATTAAAVAAAGSRAEGDGSIERMMRRRLGCCPARLASIVYLFVC